MQNLLTALCSASAEISNPKKDSKNPHFRNEYASLESVLDAVMGPLQRHGLVLTQVLNTVEGDIELRTTLWHAKSGEHLESAIRLSPQKRDPQGYAGACTYYRRLSIKSMLGLAEVDDDGNEASQLEPRQQAKPPAKQTAKPITTPAVQKVQQAIGGEIVDTSMEICAAMEECVSLDYLAELAERAKKLPQEERAECREVYLRRRDALTSA